MHASSHRENVASVDRRFISKKELHAHLPLVMTNYVRRRRALNEEFVSFSCELHLHLSRSQWPSWRFRSSTVVNVSDIRPLVLSKADFISTGKINHARTTWTNNSENESHLGVEKDQQCNADQKMDGFSLWGRSKISRGSGFKNLFDPQPKIQGSSNLPTHPSPNPSFCYK